MKKLYIIIVMFISVGNCKADCQVDTVNKYTYSIGSAVRELYGRTIYTYNANGLETQKLDQDWLSSNSSWLNISLTISTYNGNGIIINKLYQTWVVGVWQNVNQYHTTVNLAGQVTQGVSQTWSTNTSSWINSNQTLNTYNSSNLKTQYVFQLWNLSTSSWKNILNYSYAYNAIDSVSSLTSKTWDSTGNVWVNKNKTDYTYDAAGNGTINLTQSWNTSSSLWVNSMKTDFTYNANAQKTLVIRQIWDIAAAAWINQSKYEYLYAVGLQIQNIAYTWNTTSNVWLNTSKTDKSYDASGNLILQVSQDWINNNWRNYLKSDLTYNASNQMLENASQIWDTISFTWVNSDKINYTYVANGCLQLLNTYNNWNSSTLSYDVRYEFEYFNTFVLAATSEIVPSTDFIIYPNPASSIVFIEHVISAGANKFQLNILNLMGVKIYSSDSDQKLSVINFSNGIYFVSITHNNKTTIQKLIIQH